MAASQAAIEKHGAHDMQLVETLLNDAMNIIIEGRATELNNGFPSGGVNNLMMNDLDEQRLKERLVYEWNQRYREGVLDAFFRIERLRDHYLSGKGYGEAANHYTDWTK